VLEGLAGPAEFENQGERVVTGQRLMQAAGDIFLGWQRVQGIDGAQRAFYVRQLRDWKASAVVEEMVPDGMHAYGELCGWTLARAHARSGDRIAIAAYLGSGTAFDRASRSSPSPMPMIINAPAKRARPVVHPRARAPPTFVIDPGTGCCGTVIVAPA
jgi:Uncharacterized protein conserved in bacteria (DUF2252)